MYRIGKCQIGVPVALEQGRYRLENWKDGREAEHLTYRLVSEIFSLCVAYPFSWSHVFAINKPPRLILPDPLLFTFLSISCFEIHLE